MQWDLFCRVIDNLGDIGVCWRLVADLASRGERVRLWVDDDSALAWMAPGGAPGVEVRPWREDCDGVHPGDVVVEAFGCDPPEAFVAAMAARPMAPVWINLEYLSAEAEVERNHRLTSPQSVGLGRGLVKHFFYPGFTARTGGLLREPGLIERRRAFDAETWLRHAGCERLGGERVVTLFCYANPLLPELMDALSSKPTLLLATPGAASDGVWAALGPSMQRGLLRARPLPWLSQVEFDHLLWAGDLNFVRGEDSFVRAQWAGRPFVWQIYPQSDGVHRVKLDAFLDRHWPGPTTALSASVRDAWVAWNGFGGRPLALPPLQPWREHTLAWREELCAQTDLTSQLIGFAAETR